MTEPRSAVITGLGSAVPDRVMTNKDFERILDTSDEWIVQRTGIRERRLVSEGEHTSTLGSRAARAALDSAGVKPEELEMILCATVSPDQIFPSTACFIQDALGVKDIPAFDISAACSGYVYALSVASQFVQTGKYSKVLVVAADALSRFCDFSDRGSCILFSDAAGAAVLEPSADADRGVRYTVLAADGSGWDYIHLPAGGSKMPATPETVDQGLHYVQMRGRDVYKFAVEKMQWLLGDCMDKCNLTVDDVDLVVPHQVNIRIITSATEKFGFPMEKVFVNIDKYGNTSGASIGLAMDEAARAGRIKAGSTVLLAAFGAGLTWAGAVLKM